MFVNLSGVIKHFGADGILTGVDLELYQGEKIALVGRNGAGKTTLLRILNQELEPDGGNIYRAPGLKVGYLSQHSRLDPSKNVIQEAEEAYEELNQAKNRMLELEQKMEHDATLNELEEYALLHQHFASSSTYSADRDLKQMLLKMGFSEQDYSKSVKHLSGGEQTRLTLVKLLLKEPDLLILDEPTNHLDIEAIEWLERWLGRYRGAAIIVSHDRFFLQNLTERVVELIDRKTKSYPGSYEKYLKLRKEEQERLERVAKQQQAEIEKLDEYVRRFINSQRTAQARGRLKKMEKLKAEKIEPEKEGLVMSGAFQDVQRSGDLVLECKNLSIQFQHRTLFSKLDWTVWRGEKWGVIGSNGMGKSTLLKVILTHIQPTTGSTRLGSNLQIGYFSQDASHLNLDQSPLQILCEECGMLAQEARSLLGQFLIQGDDVFRPARTLSGGERNKLALACMIALQPNLIVLDEPTNHLDMPSCEALAKLLREYPGTLILVSHDRWLLGQITQKTLALYPDGIKLYPGSYLEFREKLQKDSQSTPDIKQFKSKLSKEQTLSPRELSKTIQKTAKQAEETENRIHQLESQIQEVEQKLSAPSLGEDLMALSLRHAQLHKNLQHEMSAWESIHQELEQLKAQQ